MSNFPVPPPPWLRLPPIRPNLNLHICDRNQLKRRATVDALGWPLTGALLALLVPADPSVNGTQPPLPC
jgi:hypothetical protein